MRVEDLEKKVDLLSLIAKKYNVERVGSDIYRVNPCPICGHKDHFTVYPNTNSYCSFSGCCQGGSVYKYLIEVERMSEEEAYEKLKQLAGVEEETDQRNKRKVKQQEAKKELSEEQDKEQRAPEKLTEWILELYRKQTEQDKDYFRKRGLSDGIIERYKLCIGQLDDENFKRAIIPYWKDGRVISYNARSLGIEEPKYKKPAGESPLFNEHYLKTANAGEVIFITEGEFDALAIENYGYKAIALGGAENVKKFKTAITKAGAEEKFIFVTAFDNDTAGQKAKKQLPYQSLEIPIDYKDVNEWAIKEPEIFKAALQRPHSVKLYLIKAFLKDIEHYKTFADKKTGFKNLDEHFGGLYSGLYIIGGLPAVGKTTFIHQIADQLAEQGEHVIYFSLEQSRFELVSKSLSRLTAKINFREAKTALAIRRGTRAEIIVKAIAEYEKFADNISIVEGNFATTTSYIREYIEQYMSLNNCKPFVIIDYLQIIKAEDSKTTDKQRVEEVLTELKRISRDFDIAIFVVSSLNRENYTEPLSYKSFKETGGVEYTADVLCGLQLAVVSRDDYPKKEPERKKEIQKALLQNPRQIEFVCLKNRSGKPAFTSLFEYYPQFDLFLEK